MTRILPNKNSRIPTAPSPTPWRVEGGDCPKLLPLHFLGKSNDNKNATFQNAVFPVL